MAVAVDAVRGEQPQPSYRERWLDVQGLRAVAVLVVVLDHVGMPGFPGGGFVGVDVFFVISGYVITRMLLRRPGRSDSTQSQGGAWFLDFYAKRARRIVPAATLVIALTVIATFELTNFLRGARVLPDATSASLFLANFHFIATGTDYARLGGDPSPPLQHYWSLAVEEQFYLVWPSVVLVAIVGAARTRRVTLRQMLVGLLIAIVAVSYLYSIMLTPANGGVAAFFSPLTRAGSWPSVA